MIFVCVGSREYQFNRLLIEIDKLIGEKVIKEEVFAQIGQSTYIPKNYKYNRFLNSKKFSEFQNKADIIISHGGTGALVGALKLKKQVIAVPRLSKFKEHTDDHQLQISSELAEKKLLKIVTDINNLGKTINKLKLMPIKEDFNLESDILDTIINFIESEN